MQPAPVIFYNQAAARLLNFLREVYAVEKDKLYLGAFQDQKQALEAVEELKTEGYKGFDIYVVAQHEEDISMVKEKTDAEITTADSEQESLLDRFKDFLKGEAAVTEHLEKIGFSSDEARFYAQKAKDGSILIFVDRGEASQHIGDSNDLDGTGIGQRRPIKKDPGAQAANQADEQEQLEDKMHQDQPSPGTDHEGPESGVGRVGTSQHDESGDRTLRSPDSNKTS